MWRTVIWGLAVVACSPKNEAAPGPAAGGDTRGRISPAEIQRIVREHYGLFRACYEAALKRNPALEGRISTEFVIDREGGVSDARLKESTLADPVAADCVVDHFRELRFPAPEGGIVTVVYPIHFAPG